MSIQQLLTFLFVTSLFGFVAAWLTAAVLRHYAHPVGEHRALVVRRIFLVVLVIVVVLAVVVWLLGLLQGGSVFGRTEPTKIEAGCYDLTRTDPSGKNPFHKAGDIVKVGDEAYKCVGDPSASFHWEAVSGNTPEVTAPVTTTASAETTTNPTEPVTTTVSTSDACFNSIDGSVVPYGPKVEFAPSSINSVEGPAVIEWWDGKGGKGHEGLWYAQPGQTVVFPRNTRGGFWTIEASSAMSAADGLSQLVDSHLHLVNYAQKPQHAYAAAALRTALESCDWTQLNQMLVFLPEGASTR